MKGYKGMSKDMTCRGMQYEVGKTYHISGKLALCENGLHYCKNLVDVFGFYSRDGGNRFFEIETLGDIVTDGTKCATDELLILRELEEIEVNRIVYGYGNGNGDGYGNGDGDGNGDGYGYGDGYGNGNGDGNGNGYGDGDGDGDSNGNGNGYGDGDGYGYGNGDGYGNGNGDGEISRILIYKGE